MESVTNSNSNAGNSLYNYIGLSLALFERIYLLSRKGSIEPEIWASWERWLIGSWFRVSLFALFRESEREYFTTEFAGYIDEKYRQFKQFKPIRTSGRISAHSRRSFYWALT